MKRWIFSYFLATILVFGNAAAVAAQQAFSTKIDHNFKIKEATWNGQQKMVVYYALLPLEGEAMVCGAYAISGGVPSNIVTQSLDSLLAHSRGEKLTRGLGYFKKFDYGADPQGQTAKCRKTGLAWTPALAKGVSLKPTQRSFEG